MSGVCTFDTSTKRCSNQAPFAKISKSGDGGGSGDSRELENGSNVYILLTYLIKYKQR